jgi:hypothetical protein
MGRSPRGLGVRAQGWSAGPGSGSRISGPGGVLWVVRRVRTRSGCVRVRRVRQPGNARRRKASPSTAMASWLGASARHTDAATAMVALCAVKDSMHSGPR